MSYYEKYIKYKNKYVTLKKQIGGNPCTGTTILLKDDYTLKYTGCETINKKCKFNYNSKKIKTEEDITYNNKITEYNTKLRKEILACKPTLEQLLDAGYTISEINNEINLPFTFPDIVVYNQNATKKIVFNDMNKLYFGELEKSYIKEDKYQFTTCYDKFDYSNLTKDSVDSINTIISNYWDPNLVNEQEIKKYKYLDMILYFARIILSKNVVGSNVIDIDKLGTSQILRNHLSTYDDINNLRWK